MANSLSTALATFATTNGTPWANYAAATAAVDAAFVLSTSTETETLLHTRSDARLLETNTVTDAEQTLTVDLVFAEAEKEIVVTGAEKGLAVSEEARSVKKLSRRVSSFIIWFSKIQPGQFSVEV